MSPSDFFMWGYLLRGRWMRKRAVHPECFVSCRPANYLLMIMMRVAVQTGQRCSRERMSACGRTIRDGVPTHKGSDSQSLSYDSAKSTH
jgi:hypothetical protein